MRRVRGLSSPHVGHRKVKVSEARAELRPGRDAGAKWAGPWVRQEAPNPDRPPPPAVCELHVHPDCVPFACSDCRQCHQDGHRDHVSEQEPEAGEGRGGRGGRVEPADGPFTGHASPPLAGGEPALQRALRGLQEGVRLLRCARWPALRVVRHPGGAGQGPGGGGRGGGEAWGRGLGGASFLSEPFCVVLLRGVDPHCTEENRGSLWLGGCAV